MKTSNVIRFSCFLSLFFLGISIDLPSRELVGQWDGQTIRLSTTLLQGNEYVPATKIVVLFPRRWQYDAFSGTLILIREDGVQIGLTVGDQRVKVGNKIIHTGKPVIRQEGRIFIPFFNVTQFLLPSVELKEVRQNSIHTIEATPSQSTPTPFYLVQPTPVSIPRTTPTPTFFLPDFEDLLSTMTPTPLFQPTPTPRTAPKAIIVIDPDISSPPKANNLLPQIKESTITLSVAKKLHAFLMESPNYEVLLTQNEGSEQQISPEERTGLANRSNADLFINLQCGRLFTDRVSIAAVYFMNPLLDSPSSSTPQPQPQGLLTVRWEDAYRTHVQESLRLARLTHTHLKQFFSFANIITMDNAPRPGRFNELRGLTMPGIVIELGNLAHPDTAHHLSRPQIQEEIAYHIYLAINEFLYERAGYQPRM